MNAWGMRSLRACLAGLVLCLAGSSLASAATRPFTPRFSTNADGNIALIGNTLMTCPSAATGCPAAQNAPVSSDTPNSAIDNDSFAETFVDADGDPSTFNSSSSTLTIPAGATVVFAGLYWGADNDTTGLKTDDNVSFDGQVALKVPGAVGYQTLVDTSPVDSITSGTLEGFYQGFANVTSEVNAAGSGTYWVGNVQASEGPTAFAGWSLVVVYTDPGDPERNLTVFDGYQGVEADSSVTIPVAGFQTPTSGPVSTQLGFVAWEGDRGLVGDSAALVDTTSGHNATPHTLSNQANPADNFFNSSISNLGVEPPPATRDPDYSNTLGLDADIVDATGDLGNGATSADIDLTTSGDIYAPGVATFATLLYAPQLSETKTVTDTTSSGVTGNGTSAAVGVQENDNLAYDISGSNSGEDAAVGTTVVDQLPAGVTYVPGSVNATVGTTSVPVSYDPGSNTVTADLGTVAPGQSYDVSFDATVNSPATDGSVIDNTANLSYTGATLGNPGGTSASATAAVSAPDLAITKTHEGTVTAGAQVTYDITVTNHGSAPTQGTVTVTDTPGDGLSDENLTSDNSDFSCTGLTCTNLNPIAPGATDSFTLTATVDQAQSAAVSNTATVSGGGDADTTDNSATDSTNPAQSADLSLSKTASSSTINVGDQVTYSLAVTNNGPSQATGVTATDTLPSQLQYVSSDSDCTQSTTNPSLVTCSLSTLDAGATHTFQIVASAPPSSAGQMTTNTAQVGAATADPISANNQSSATVNVNPIDVAVTKKLLTTNPTVGGPAN
jgi:uncharacterized repeat protein (TIGR01451 family)/fimbrial isopeptide formation D2 family protein